MFLEYPSEAKSSDVSTLVSPKIENTTSVCLSFAYIMSGAKSGTLTIFTGASVHRNKRQIFQRRGKQGNDWIVATISIKHAENNSVSIKCNVNYVPEL